MKNVWLMFSLIKFARKEQLQFKTNLVVGIFSMILNDILWMSLFIIFIAYFKKTWLQASDFLLTMWFATFYYWLIHWLFANFWSLCDIIEKWSLDYFLSLPKNSLIVMSTLRMNPFSLWDVFFAFILSISYWVFFSSNFLLTTSKWFVIYLLWSLFVIGCYLIVWSISFWLDKWSEFHDIYEHFFVWMSMYPPPVLKRIFWIFLICSMVWMYPAYFLPFNIIKYGWSIYEWLFLVFISCVMFFLWLWIYNKGLKKYSSWNLVVTN